MALIAKDQLDSTLFSTSSTIPVTNLALGGAKTFLGSNGSVNSFSAGPLNYNNMIFVQDQKTSGTNGGTSTATTTSQRNLNTVINNTITGASLATNQVTLPAGTYYVEGTAPAYSANAHKCRLFNVTDAAYVVEGTSEQVTNAQQVQSNSLLNGVVTIAASKVFELRHYTSVGQTSLGFGVATSQGTEIYSTLKFWKVA